MNRRYKEALSLSQKYFKCGLKFINSMNKLTIRLAKERDVLQISEIIYRWSRWQRERNSTIKEVIRKSNQDILVAELNGKIVGVLQQTFFPDIMLGGYNCHVNFLLVDKNYRGKKIGSQLMDKTIENAKKRGAMEMHVDTIYKKAVKFYRKRGFKDNGIMLELALQKDHNS